VIAGNGSHNSLVQAEVLFFPLYGELANQYFYNNNIVAFRSGTKALFLSENLYGIGSGVFANNIIYVADSSAPSLFVESYAYATFEKNCYTNGDWSAPYVTTNYSNVPVSSWSGEPAGIISNPSWLNGIILPTASTVPWANWPMTFHGSDSWVLANTSPLIKGAANLFCVIQCD
jgi:hypothetical protein